MTPCIEWKGSLDRNGYGRIVTGGKTVMAHVRAYVRQHGPVPDGMELDHVCRNRACVNVGHLEAVTHRENCIRRDATRETCTNGHPFSGRNSRGQRICHQCLADAARKRRLALAEK